jgi:hypothetical protein
MEINTLRIITSPTFAYFIRQKVHSKRARDHLDELGSFCRDISMDLDDSKNLKSLCGGVLELGKMIRPIYVEAGYGLAALALEDFTTIKCQHVRKSSLQQMEIWIKHAQMIGLKNFALLLRRHPDRLQELCTFGLRTQIGLPFDFYVHIPGAREGSEYIPTRF